jgi:hypothetical protein
MVITYCQYFSMNCAVVDIYCPVITLSTVPRGGIMSNARPELNNLEKAIADILKQHPDTSLASLAGRQMLAEQLASQLCKDAGIDKDNLRHFISWLVFNPTQPMDAIQRDWLWELLTTINEDIALRKYSVLVPLKGW